VLRTILRPVPGVHPSTTGLAEEETQAGRRRLRRSHPYSLTESPLPLTKPARVSLLRYTQAQRVVILVPCSGNRCTLEGNVEALGARKRGRGS